MTAVDDISSSSSLEAPCYGAAAAPEQGQLAALHGIGITKEALALMAVQYAAG